MILLEGREVGGLERGTDTSRLNPFSTQDSSVGYWLAIGVMVNYILKGIPSARVLAGGKGVD